MSSRWSIGGILGRLLAAADEVRDRAGGRPGGRGEDLAHRHLQAAGYIVVARNYRTPSGSGEIDIVARDGGTLVFVEVKSRATSEHGDPDRAIDGAKRRRIAGAGRDYARRAGIAWDLVRFDVVTVILSQPPQVVLIRDAFRP